MRLGLLGGAFNPPHLGHLILAQEAAWQLDLERVVFMPYGEPSHRSIEDDPGAEARLTMCEYAVSADARFAVSRMEIDRAGPTYTVDTLRELHERADFGSSDAEIFLLLGGDQAASLPTWHSPEEVLSLAVVAVAERDEWRRSSIEDRLGSLYSDDRVRFFGMPRVEISSSMVRRRAHARQPIRYLVPDKVANYVGAQSLYGAAPAAAGSVSGGAASADPASGGPASASPGPGSGHAGSPSPADPTGAVR